jgi:hypothetical protein
MHRSLVCVCVRARGVQLGRTDSGDLTEPLHGALGYAAPTPFKHPARFILALATARGVRTCCDY